MTLAELQAAITGRLGAGARFAEPLARHTTWGVGGPAWCLARVGTAADAAWLRDAARAAGLTVKALGRGSNLLVSDAGYPGVLLRLWGPLAKIRVAGNELVCGGGAALPAAVRLAARVGLAGLEWAGGIPATVGGAVATNAGALGGDLAGVAARLTLLLPDGRAEEFAGRELPAAYRRRELPPGSLVLEARLALAPDEPGQVAERLAGILARRRASQPLGSRTAGSVFKNPAGEAAGRLVDLAGLKGQRRGGARVSPQHANFIENTGGATAADIRELMALMAERVFQMHGVRLEPEVEVLGEV
ncbi:MAG: UDP-N-acetylmuramate dehydrogenase [Deltaproteobacteria bacterium]|nr:UDP-N-acetylmuramate dehydrogenase [Deltaproteobacteria bacterium]